MVIRLGRYKIYRLPLRANYCVIKVVRGQPNRSAYRLVKLTGKISKRNSR